MIITDWADTITRNFQSFGSGFINFVPNLIASIVVFIIGWFVAVAIGKLIAEVLKKVKFDAFLEKKGWKEAMDRADIKMGMSDFFGGLCKWILIILFLGIAADILGLETFSAFITEVVKWLPNLVVAILIFVVTVILANIAQKAAEASMIKAKLDYVDFAGSIVKWAIWISGILAILMQLGVMTGLLDIIVKGFVFMIAGAAALAFGLGGKEAAADAIRAIRNKIKK